MFDGLDQQTQQESHTNKTMDVAFTVYAFKDRIDNEVDRIKLGLFQRHDMEVLTMQT